MQNITNHKRTSNTHPTLLQGLSPSQ